MGEAKKAAAPVDWGREGARRAGVADEPHRGEPELRSQVRAIVSGADNRAVGALQKSLKAAPAAGAKLAKSWQSGFGASLALLAQLDAGGPDRRRGRARVLKAFALGTMEKSYDFETIAIS